MLKHKLKTIVIDEALNVNLVWIFDGIFIGFFRGCGSKSGEVSFGLCLLITREVENIVLTLHHSQNISNIIAVVRCFT